MDIRLEDIQVERLGMARLPHKPITIAPLGDIHYGHDAFDKGRLREHLQEIAKQDTYYIGLGDYLDISAGRSRQAMTSHDLHDSARDAIDHMIREQIDEFLTIMKKTKGKWLGMITGHHWHQFLDGTTTDQILCRELECTWLGRCGMVKVQLVGGKKTQKLLGAIWLWAHHGSGGAQTPGGVLNKLEKLASRWHADIYMMGHLHQVGYSPIPYKVPTREARSVVDRPKHLIATGSFRKAYPMTKAVPSYEEKRALLPNLTGSGVIKLFPKHYGPRSEYWTPGIQYVGPKYEVPQ